jgi:hypothetical protein
MQGIAKLGLRSLELTEVAGHAAQVRNERGDSPFVAETLANP